MTDLRPIPPITPPALNALQDALHAEGLPLSMRQLLGYSVEQLDELAGWLDAIQTIRLARGPLPLELLPAPPEFVEAPVTSPQADGCGR